MTCVVCGPVGDATPEDHLASSEHRNAVEVDAHLRASFYRRMSSDFCTRCGLLVHVEAIVLVDGENRPLVRCPQDHLEAQR